MRKKMGWTAKGIVGWTLLPIGLIFVPIALVFWQSGAIPWEHPDDPIVFLATFGGLGGMFLLLGLILLGADIRRRYLLRRAYYGGYCVNAEIIGITEQRNVNLSNGHPRVVECAYTDDSGVVHVYRSRYLFTDVTKMLQSATVPVYIDRDHDKVGFVDIDAVLPEIRIHS